MEFPLTREDFIVSHVDDVRSTIRIDQQYWIIVDIISLNGSDVHIILPKIMICSFSDFFSVCFFCVYCCLAGSSGVAFSYLPTSQRRSTINMNIHRCMFIIGLVLCTIDRITGKNFSNWFEVKRNRSCLNHSPMSNIQRKDSQSIKLFGKDFASRIEWINEFEQD